MRVFPERERREGGIQESFLGAGGRKLPGGELVLFREEIFFSWRGFQRGIAIFFSAGRRVVSFPKFGWRGEIHIQRRFSCLRIKFLLLEEYSESGASLGVKVCW